ncbi:MAG: UDP-N-acetylglucosamine--N-acetylmuramyl-(pentapeptide) pyrophosphoryl-undecaprenol N-acetylglucosamine transferase [Cycloclasticus sp. symbiont of Poecilosclerida sp. M]|nr:MAG: UDP-N-acetylglucosamine--N-acetylmuramyl-(pentapeptide) pyrophosphoryl-undecaprenol N-acetylglucosamine transferase [Cycloclasticus sp. symbiont of Poecilosclerida sp. M]
MAVRIMIMAGGTGGHVFPALAVAQWLIDAGHNVSWLGTRKGLESRVVPAANISIDWLSVAGVRGKGVLSILFAPFMLLVACWQAMRIISARNPDVILGLGGFASGPGGLMAWVLRKPLVIHEQNRVPGTTNKLLKKLSTRVLEAFPKSFSADSDAICTGNPIRKNLMVRNKKGPSDGLKLLVIGGSLGASILNQVVPYALKNIQNELAIDVVHQSGKTTLEAAKSNYKQAAIKAKICEFIEDMSAVYSWADLVICRAGAMTISEVAIMGLPTIIVPLPSAIDDHQTKNAQYLSDAGAAVLIPQSEFSVERLEREIKGIAEDANKRTKMGNKAFELAKPGATERVANICLEVAL